MTRRKRREPVAPCPYCGMPVYIGRPTRTNPGYGRKCHTCDLFAYHDLNLTSTIEENQA